MSSAHADPTAELLALYHAGDLDSADAAGRRIVAAAPRDTTALSVVGVIEARRGRFAEALGWFERAIEADPELKAAHVNRGHALDALGRYHDAVTSYSRAVALGADSAHVQLRMASALQRCGGDAEALAALERALELDPLDLPALYERVDLLLKLGRDGDAVVALARARAAGGDPDRIEYAMAALGLAPAAAASPRSYVRDLFDGYADGFDAHLVGHLGYRGPQLIADALAALSPAPPLDVVDLGCGTGLCAPVLRPLARRLVGVDLSARMLERAQARGGYDELVCEEIVAFAALRPQAFDLAAAADVLNYFGALDAPLAALRTMLRPGGWLVFTLEASDRDAVVLNRTRRFAHSRAHVEQAARGWTLHGLDAVTLRREGAGEVAGWVVVLRRPE